MKIQKIKLDCFIRLGGFAMTFRCCSAVADEERSNLCGSLKFLNNKILFLITVFFIMLFFKAYASELPLLNSEITIEEAVSIAFSNNFELKITQKEIEEYSARIKTAESKINPAVSANVSASTSSVSNMLTTGITGVNPDTMTMMPESQRTSANLSLSLPLFTGGTLQSQIQKSRYEELAYKSYFDSVKLDIAYKTRALYLQYLEADSSAQISEKAYNAKKELFRVTEAFYNVGKVAKFYLLRNEAELSQARQNLIEAKNQRAVKLIELKNIMGINLESDITIAGKLSIPSPIPTLEETLITAFNLRPELKNIDNQIQAAEYNIKAFEGKLNPQSYLLSRYDFRTPTEGDFKDGYTVGVVLSMPVFDGGERSSEITEAKAFRDKLTIQKEQLRQEISKEIYTVYLNLNSAREKIETQVKIINKTAEELRIAQLRYKYGKGINLEVLDAIETWVSSEKNYLNSIYEYNLYYAQYLRVVGTF